MFDWKKRAANLFLDKLNELLDILEEIGEYDRNNETSDFIGIFSLVI